MSQTSEAAEHRYLDVFRSIRPVRTAVLVVPGDSWHHYAERVLEGLSRLWGGCGDGVFVADGKWGVHPAFWPLLRALDPDQLSMFQESLRSFQMADPDGFERWLDAQADALAKQHGRPVDDVRADLTSQTSMYGRGGPWPVADSVRDQCRSWLALGTDQVPFANVLTADAPPARNLTDLLKLTWMPEKVQLIAADNWGPAIQLLVESRTGRLAPSHREALEARGCEVETVPTGAEDLARILELAWTGTIDTTFASLSAALTPGGAPDVDTVPVLSLALTPFAHSAYGCSWLVRAGIETPDPVIVLGDRASDFAFALTRERVVGRTLWVPYAEVTDKTELGRTITSALNRVLHEMTRTDPEPGKIAVTSLSISGGEIEAVVAALRSELWGDRLSFQVVDPASLAHPRVRTLRDMERFSDPYMATFYDGRLASLLEVPLPTMVRGDANWDCRWQADFFLPEYRVPARTKLAPIIESDDFARASVRSGADGISYGSHSMGFVYAGTRLPHMLVRPRIRLPDAREIFGTLLEGHGTLTESSAGRYTRHVLDLWGGLDALAADLASSDRSRLLAGWLADSPSRKDPGVFLQLIRRRMLTLEDGKEVTGAAIGALRETLDGWSLRGIVRRGLVLACERCSAADFYDLEVLGPGFRCSRCRTAGAIRSSAWKEPEEEPEWYYALDEAVYQMLRANGDVPVRALARLARGHQSFLSMPECKVDLAAGGAIELDIWAIADGVIAVGEAKINDVIEDRARAERTRCQEMAAIAAAVGADQFILATSAPAWNPRSSKAMAEALPAGIELVVYEGT